jgi:hypothetical protein
MCFKRKIITLEPANLRLLSYTINNYPGSVNDLNGCNNDGKQLKETLLNYWDFDIHRFIDWQATVENFKNYVSAAIKSLSPGATILVLPDSCFSGTVTRLMNPRKDHPTRNRFYQQPGIKMQPKIKTGVFAGRGDIRWVVISGCGETEYSADCFIAGEYHGAFSYFACNTLKPGITYKQWHTEICKYLPGTEFEQAPTIEGPEYLQNQIVFSNQTLVLHNSTHGTQIANGGSDEPIDEAICFYNGNLRDDDYNLLLQQLI